jgi:hypothetical protein
LPRWPRGQTEQHAAKQTIMRKSHTGTANQEMECPSRRDLASKWLGLEDVDMNELTAQQAQEPTAHQRDIHATGNADLGRIIFGDVHENRTNYAAEKSPGKYFHQLPRVASGGIDRKTFALRLPRMGRCDRWQENCASDHNAVRSTLSRKCSCRRTGIARRSYRLLVRPATGNRTCSWRRRKGCIGKG